MPLKKGKERKYKDAFRISVSREHRKRCAMVGREGMQPLPVYRLHLEDEEFLETKLDKKAKAYFTEVVSLPISKGLASERKMLTEIYFTKKLLFLSYKLMREIYPQDIAEQTLDNIISGKIKIRNTASFVTVCRRIKVGELRKKRANNIKETYASIDRANIVSYLQDISSRISSYLREGWDYIPVYDLISYLSVYIELADKGIGDFTREDIKNYLKFTFETFAVNYTNAYKTQPIVFKIFGYDIADLTANGTIVECWGETFTVGEEEYNTALNFFLDFYKELKNSSPRKTYPQLEVHIGLDRVRRRLVKGAFSALCKKKVPYLYRALPHAEFPTSLFGKNGEAHKSLLIYLIKVKSSILRKKDREEKVLEILDGLRGVASSVPNHAWEINKQDLDFYKKALKFKEEGVIKDIVYFDSNDSYEVSQPFKSLVEIEVEHKCEEVEPLCASEKGALTKQRIRALYRQAQYLNVCKCKLSKDHELSEFTPNVPRTPHAVKVVVNNVSFKWFNILSSMCQEEDKKLNAMYPFRFMHEIRIKPSVIHEIELVKGDFVAPRPQ